MHKLNFKRSPRIIVCSSVCSSCLTLHLCLCVCAGATALHKALSTDGIPLSTVLPSQTSPAILSLHTQYRQLAVVVDVGCAEGVTFVAQVSYCLLVASNVVTESSTDVWLRLRKLRSGESRP